MLLFSQLERIASEGGYRIAGRKISRITVADVHRLQAGLARTSADGVQEAALAVARLRRWMVHGDGTVPPVRGAGYMNANREVWMAYTDLESPALLRGRPSVLAELRHFLSMASNPDYHGHMRAKTNPPVEIEMNGESFALKSKAGVAAVGMRDAVQIDHWISITMKPKDRQGVLCLPAHWIPE